MAYLTLKQVKEQYSVAEKTIRRLYENKTLSRSQAYKNRKGKWQFNSDYIQAQFGDRIKVQPAQQVNPEPMTRQSDNGDQALIKTIEILQQQLEVKDKQIDNLTQLTDQQQKLTAQLQTRLLITSPTEPIQQDNKSEVSKAKPKTKKSVSKPVKPSSDTKKASKPKSKRWWSRKK